MAIDIIGSSNFWSGRKIEVRSFEPVWKRAKINRKIVMLQWCYCRIVRMNFNSVGLLLKSSRLCARFANCLVQFKIKIPSFESSSWSVDVKNVRVRSRARSECRQWFAFWGASLCLGWAATLSLWQEKFREREQRKNGCPLFLAGFEKSLEESVKGATFRREVFLQTTTTQKSARNPWATLEDTLGLPNHDLLITDKNTTAIWDAIEIVRIEIVRIEITRTAAVTSSNKAAYQAAADSRLFSRAANEDKNCLRVLKRPARFDLIILRAHLADESKRFARKPSEMRSGEEETI